MSEIDPLAALGVTVFAWALLGLCVYAVTGCDITSDAFKECLISYKETP